MSFTTTYVDDTGKRQTVSISESDSKEALKNDYCELMKRYNPKYVSIQRIQAKSGEELHLRVTVSAPTHYLSSAGDTSPKECSSMSVDIVAYLGYPIKALSAFYPAGHYLASPNVFHSGAACIDTWIPFTSSLLTVVEKLVMDIIHNPTVTRYDSPANLSMIQWHKDGVAAGRFPTISPKFLHAPSTPALPPRSARAAVHPAPPALPSRRR